MSDSGEATPTAAGATEEQRQSLFVASNRLPVTLSRSRGQFTFKASSGGLATAMAGLPGGRFTWIGWPGMEVRPDEQDHVTERLRDELGALPVYLSRGQIEQYYNRFSNGVLWPLFHYLPDFTDFDLEGWSHYEEVNRRFAERIDEEAPYGAFVWVQDYHLMLLPKMLRDRRPDLKIAIFLHIPFPSSEVYRLLPVRAEILEGLLGADVVGFHTYDYARHFLSACQRILGCDHQPRHVIWNGRIVGVAVNPIGIDLEKFEKNAEAVATRRELKTLEEQMGERKVVLGVDRLDYSKGLRHKIRAFRRFLDLYPDMADKVVLVQVAVPSRTGVQRYRQLRREIEELVGRTNGEHGTPTHSPIHFLFKSVKPATLTALYQLASVCLVTPIRDGMNLVCQEFVASNRSDGSGVLLLSEFAGAARSLEGAFSVNPWNEDQVAHTLKHALELPREERQRRMSRMQEFVRSHSAKDWAREFIASVRHHLQTAGNPLPERYIERNLEPAKREFRAAKRRIIILDYDGTLAAFAETPAAAAPSSDVVELLSRLARLPETYVYVVTSRSRETMLQWLQDPQLGLCVDDGRLLRRPEQGEWNELASVSTEWMESVLPVLRSYARMTPGAIVVRRSTSLEWHWRRCDPEFGQWQARELALELSETMTNQPVRVTQGSKVVAVRSQAVYKGLLVDELKPELAPDDFVLAVGDDEDDEDMFWRLPEEAWSVRIGTHSPHARFLAKRQASIPGLLRELAACWQSDDL
jgi:trehalose 6-phosphate synthase/phosphatase